ncbi:MAG: hypothetical protein A3C53_05890 [Omnitrophica WOR_2 bacterium RIFCSPHIGHO2_02_FULL_68_15]|nr:MAG: hypothetical protein A3C53_05890 [Omnitrophica WOR_2 bacterium RIFCSPHIGHO2_02_FULL_68_15]
MRLFVDSSAFIALADDTDRDHRAANGCSETWPVEIQLHASNYIVAETITRLRRTVGHRAALQWAKAARGNPQITWHYADDETDREALRVFERYHDHPLSFVDCTTVVWLQRLHLDRIFTFDHDFQRLGYTLVPGLTS